MDHAYGYVPLDQRVRELVRAGTDINALDRLTRLTALDYAMLRNERPVVRTLMESGGVNSPR